MLLIVICFKKINNNFHTEQFNNKKSNYEPLRFPQDFNKKQKR